MYKEASYTYDILEDFLFIEDLGESDRISVTNDMESVLKKIKEEIGDEINSLKCIYKDSQGVWDGVKFEFNSQEEVIISGFLILDETDLEKAVVKYTEKISDDRKNDKEEKFLFKV
jgi:hypothetical protein